MIGLPPERRQVARVEAGRRLLIGHGPRYQHSVCETRGVGRRRKQHRRTDEALAREVLRGEHIRVEQLAALIHRLNPTAKGLGPSLTQERYALKSQLQSELIVRYPAYVVVRPDGDGVVALDHPLGQYDSCHAVVAELSPEARSAVQRQLDERGLEPDPAASEAVPPGDHANGPVGGDTGGDTGSPAGAPPLLRARELLDAFDFPAAEAALREALASPGTALAAARELLRLQVQTLGDLAAAEQLARSLPGELAADPQVRALLALAAARAGDAATAWTRLDGLGAPLAAEALTELGARAADRRDLTTVDRARDRLPGGSVGHRELSRLRDQLLADLLDEEIAALEGALAGDELDAAAAAAVTLRGRGPLPGRARRLLAELDARLEEQRQRAALSALAAAVEGGDFDATETLAHTLLDAHPELQAPIEDLLETAYQRELGARAARVEALLRDDAPTALYAWLALPEEGRVRVQHPPTAALRAHAARLDAAHDEHPDAIPAARALVGALAATAPEEILARLDHPLLAGDPVADGLRTRATRALDARAAEQDAAVEQRALSALSRGDWARAQRELAGLGQRSPGGASLRADAEALAEAERLAPSDPLAALELIRGVETLDPALRDARLVDLGAATQEWFRLRVHPPGEAGVADIALTDLPRPDSSHTRGVGSTEGADLLCAVAGSKRVLVRRISPDLAVTLAFSLQVPEPLAQPVALASRGPHLVLVDSAGRVLQLRTDTPAVLAWWRLPAHRPAQTAALPDPRFLWLFDPEGACVIDLEARSVRRRLEGVLRVMRLETTDGPRVIASGIAEHRIRTLDGAGCRADLGAFAEAEALAPDPRTPGALIALTMSPSDRMLRARTRRPGGVPTAPSPLLKVQNMLQTLPSREAPELLVRTTRDDSPGPVVAFTLDEQGRATELWRTPPLAHLSGIDREGLQPVLLTASLDGPILRAVGPEAPELGTTLAVLGDLPGQVDLFIPCAAKKLGEFHTTFDRYVENARGAERDALLDEALGDLDRGGRLVALAHALWQAGDEPRLLRLLSEADVDAFDRQPGRAKGQVRRGLARVAAQEALWERVVDLLDHPDALERKGAFGRHAHHVLAVALGHEGRVADALRVLDRGEDLLGGCDLSALRALLVRHEGRPPDDATCVAHARWSEGAARKALQAGDAEGAIRLLDRPPIWMLADPPCLRLLRRALRETGRGDTFRASLVEAALTEG